MRMVARILALALSMFALSGCIPQEPAPEPTSAPTAAPIFASEEEALAAAEEAYAAYLAVSDQILNEGGADPDRIEAVAIGEFSILAIEGFESFARSGYRSVGQTTFSSAELQRFEPSGGTEAVVIYLCQDVSAVDVVDTMGASVVSPDRPDFSRLEVAFDASSDAELLVSGSEIWGDGSC